MITDFITVPSHSVAQQLSPVLENTPTCISLPRQNPIIDIGKYLRRDRLHTSTILSTPYHRKGIAPELINQYHSAAIASMVASPTIKPRPAVYHIIAPLYAYPEVLNAQQRTKNYHP